MDLQKRLDFVERIHKFYENRKNHEEQEVVIHLKQLAVKDYAKKQSEPG